MTTQTFSFQPAGSGQRSKLTLPKLAIALTALPILLTLAYSGSSLYESDLATVLALAWNAIPLVWVASIGVGIATVMRRNLRWWRIIGVVAILLPIAEVVTILIAFTVAYGASVNR